ncbi:MAG TPA: hypothetical protein VNZ86_20930, partial [Bacteroidia bacterium]|nr:hypothetical protein [Bacteroidia bacterium]
MKTTIKTVFLCFMLVFSFQRGIAQQLGNKKNDKTIQQDSKPGKDPHIPYNPEDFKNSTYYKAQHGAFGFKQVPSADPKALKFAWRAPNLNCNNVGMEDTTFANWSGYYGINDTLGVTWTSGFLSAGINANCSNVNACHTLMDIPPGNNNPALGPLVGYDSIAINTITGLADIPFVAPGGGHVSARLGNYVVIGTVPSGNGQKIQRLDYTMTVTANTSEFNYQYAVVLNLPPSGHLRSEMPYFQITLLDSAGGVLSSTPCNSYHITADSAATDHSFLPYNGGSANASGYYKKWTAVSIDLTPYFGRTITIDFKSADCSRGGHYGYAYVDATCDALRPINGMCPGDSVALLVAPSGYNNYQWFDTLGHAIPAPLGTKDSLLILHGHPGNVYTLNMISHAGCLTVLKDTLRYTNISANSVTSGKTCYWGHTGTATVIPQGGVYGYRYSWNPPAGDTTATITGLLPGTYTV